MYIKNLFLLMIVYIGDFLIPYRQYRVIVYDFRNILDIESWENRGRDI